MVAKPTILVVDYRHANLIALEALLAEEYRVLFAHSGVEALAKLQEDARIDVILLDVQMPVMDGFRSRGCDQEAAEVARDIPIIFVTAVYNEDPHIKQRLRSGRRRLLRQALRPGYPASIKLRDLRIVPLPRATFSGSASSTYASPRSCCAWAASFPRSWRACRRRADRRRRRAASVQTNRGGLPHLQIGGAGVPGAYGEFLGWWDGAGKMIKMQGGSLSRALGGAQSHSQPLLIQCFDGSTKTILVSASPLRGLDDRLVGAVILVQDMTGAAQDRAGAGKARDAPHQPRRADRRERRSPALATSSQPALQNAAGFRDRASFPTRQ